MKFSTLFLIGALACTPVAAQQPGSSPKPDQARFEEIARFKSEAARQGVAADADHFYSVTDLGIAKHEKKTGKLVAEWKGPKDGPIIHLDSGAIVDGKL